MKKNRVINENNQKKESNNPAKEDYRDLINLSPISPCACIGPVGKDPVCPCRMEERGLRPDYPEVDSEKTKVAFAAIFGWGDPT